MVWPKRARTAETPTRPSPDLRLRAPYFYPDPAFASLSMAGSERIGAVGRLALLLVKSGDPSADPLQGGRGVRCGSGTVCCRHGDVFGRIVMVQQ